MPDDVRALEKKGGKTNRIGAGCIKNPILCYLNIIEFMLLTPALACLSVCKIF